MYSEHYSEDSFWKKVARFAGTAWKAVIEQALVLYYCLNDSDTPKWARGVILGALGYFILPIDAVPDFLPGGRLDDLGVLAAALFTVAVHIKPEHREKAAAAVRRWFGGWGGWTKAA